MKTRGRRASSNVRTAGRPSYGERVKVTAQRALNSLLVPVRRPPEAKLEGTQKMLKKMDLMAIDKRDLRKVINPANWAVDRGIEKVLRTENRRLPNLLDKTPRYR